MALAPTREPKREELWDSKSDPRNSDLRWRRPLCWYSSSSEPSCPGQHRLLFNIILRPAMATLLQMFCRQTSLWGPLIQTQRDFTVGAARLIRMHCIPKPKQVDRWTEKRAMFGIYDNIGILGDFKAHPKDLIIAPCWLKGWKGIELQRCIRKKKMVGDRMFAEDLHNLNKRIRFLYRRFNRYGKHR